MTMLALLIWLIFFLSYMLAGEFLIKLPDLNFYESFIATFLSIVFAKRLARNIEEIWEEEEDKEYEDGE